MGKNAKKEEVKKPGVKKEVSKAEASQAAEGIQDVQKLKDLIVEEMLLVTEGKRVDIQKAMAYCRNLKVLLKK